MCNILQLYILFNFSITSVSNLIAFLMLFLFCTFKNIFYKYLFHIKCEKDKKISRKIVLCNILIKFKYFNIIILLISFGIRIYLILYRPAEFKFLIWSFTSKIARYKIRDTPMSSSVRLILFFRIRLIKLTHLFIRVFSFFVLKRILSYATTFEKKISRSLYDGNYRMLSCRVVISE